MKGILFNEVLFPEVIDESKTQTRRIVKPQPTICLDERSGGRYIGKPVGENGFINPRYKVGEILYLKEPYIIIPPNFIAYKYDKENTAKTGWKNKLFMPEKYARYFIEITGVRCERLQEISDYDCWKEGIIEDTCSVAYKRYKCPISQERFHRIREAYASLINKINGKGTWKSNPYVWVYDFKLVKK